jgi:hypothetical protein
MSYDSCPPPYNAYRVKTLHSKLVKKTKGNKIIWLSWATCPHMLTVVYFDGRPGHTRSHWSIFMGNLPKYSKWSIFKGDRPTHSHLPWSIFMGDLSKHAHSGLFSRATCLHTLTLVLVYFHGDLPKHTQSGSGLFSGATNLHPHTYPGLFSWATCPSRKRKSGLIVMGDLPRWRNGLIVISDLPR